jgi:hypothetical protein
MSIFHAAKALRMVQDGRDPTPYLRLFLPDDLHDLEMASEQLFAACWKIRRERDTNED